MGTARRKFSKIEAAEKRALERAADFKPLYGLELSRALNCEGKVNDNLCSCFLDTGSGLFLVSEEYAVRRSFMMETKSGPSVCTASSQVFTINKVCGVAVTLLGMTLTGKCWVTRNSSFDI